MALSRDAILAVDDLKKEPVNVPEWGGDVIVSELSADDADAFSASLSDTKIDPTNGKQVTLPNLLQARAKLAVKVLVDDNGQRMFTDADVDALGKKSSNALKLIWDVGTRLSGIGDDLEPKLAELEGESDAVPSDGSPSGSPENSDSPQPTTS